MFAAKDIIGPARPKSSSSVTRTSRSSEPPRPVYTCVGLALPNSKSRHSHQTVAAQQRSRPNCSSLTSRAGPGATCPTDVAHVHTCTHNDGCKHMHAHACTCLRNYAFTACNQHNEEPAELKPDHHTGFKVLTVPGNSKGYIYARARL